MAGRRKIAKLRIIAGIQHAKREQERMKMAFLSDQSADSDAWLRPARPVQCDVATWEFLHTANHLMLLKEVTPLADTWTSRDELQYVRRGGNSHVA
jgi:hypothetical protein